MRVVAMVVLTLMLGRSGGLSAQGAALTSLFNEMQEDRLKREPEGASMMGDRRYNDQVSDLSPCAYNEGLARDRGYLMRLLVIDATGMSGHDKLLAGLLQEELLEAEEGAKFKEWQLPVSAAHDVAAEMAGNVARYPFATVKDYDDYIARLKKYPTELRQASSDMLAGIGDGRVPALDVVKKSAARAEEIAGQKPEESVFARPLERFPAAVSAADRKRIKDEMLDAIQDEVLPAYARFAAFLKAREVPAAQVADWAAKDGEAFAAFCARRAATWKRIAELGVGNKSPSLFRH